MVDTSRVADAAEVHGKDVRADGGTGSERPPDTPFAAMKQAWSAVGKRVPEMREDLQCYASVQADRVRLAVSQAHAGVVSGILRLVAVAVVFATAMSLLLVGAAGGMAVALHGNVWLADLITGAAALLVLGGALLLAIRSRNRERMLRLQRRYRSHEARDRHHASTARPGARTHDERS